MPLNEQRNFQGFQHIKGVAVGAHAYQNAFFHHLADGGAAYGIAHVAFGIVADHSARIPENVYFPAVQVDAVAQHGPFPQNAVVQQPVHRTGAVAQTGIIYIVEPFGYMDMVARAAVVGGLHLSKVLSSMVNRA